MNVKNVGKLSNLSQLLLHTRGLTQVTNYVLIMNVEDHSPISQPSLNTREFTQVRDPINTMCEEKNFNQKSEPFIRYLSSIKELTQVRISVNAKSVGKLSMISDLSLYARELI
jgi:hypothetical protein